MITPTRPQLPAYGGVHLEATRGRLTARGTNGETTVTAVARVSNVTDGTVLVPPGPVQKYLAALPEDTELVVASASRTQLEVTPAGGNGYKFTAMPDSFPTNPIPRRDKVEADLSDLDDAVAAVAGCADSLGGSEKVVQLVSDATGLKLHATDRFRVARASLPPAAGFGDFDGLLPVRVLTLVAALDATHVQVDPRGRSMVFHAADAVVSTRLAQDPFPVVDSVLSAEVPYTASLARATVLAALKRLSSVAPQNGTVTVDLSGDQLTLAVVNAAAGSGSEVVHLEGPASGDLSTAVNLEFLRSAFDTHTADVVTLGWVAALKPLFVTSTDTVPITHAIMPVQV